jgi:hypothetical protein
MIKLRLTMYEFVDVMVWARQRLWLDITGGGNWTAVVPADCIYPISQLLGRDLLDVN